MNPGLLRNIGWLGLANLLVKPLWFVFITAILMRLLGAEGYGIFTAALALAGLAMSFTDVGMNRYTVREVARRRSVASTLISNFLVFRLALVLVAIIVTLPAGWILGYKDDALWAVGLAAVYMAALTTTHFMRGILEAHEALKIEAVLLVLEKVLVITGGMLCVVAARKAEWVLAGMAAGMILTTVVHIVTVDRKLARFKAALVDRTFIWKKLPRILPFGLAGLLTAFYFRVDLVMVEVMVGAVGAGQYGAAFRILEGLLMFPSIVVLSALFPRMSRLEHKGDREGFGRLVRVAAGWLALGSLAISIVLTIFAADVIHLLSPSPEFAPASTALGVLNWTLPLVCINYLLYSALVTANDERFIWIALLAIVIFNVTTNLFAIPRFGIQGAAWTTVISEGLLCVVYYLRFRVRMPECFATP